MIAPDLRGYGGSEAPEAVEAYDISHLTGDLVGLLDALGIERAVFMGHDWGGLVLWRMPLFHQARVAGVIGINTPFVPHWMLWLRPDLVKTALPQGRTFVVDPTVDQTVRVPSLMVSAEHDVVLRPSMADGMEAHVPDLERHVVADCWQWTPEEKPEKLNRLAISWLSRRYPSEPAP